MLVLVLPTMMLIVMLMAMAAQMMVMMKMTMITTMAAAADQRAVHEDEERDQYTHWTKKDDDEEDEDMNEDLRRVRMWMVLDGKINDDADDAESGGDDNNGCRLHERTQFSLMRIGFGMQAVAVRRFSRRLFKAPGWDLAKIPS